MSSPSVSDNDNTPILERGKACLRCRRRKMRCDGVRPTCSQCLKAEVPQDCEFTDGGLTTSQILERNIADLEARISEILKGPAPGTIALKKPWKSSKRLPRRSSTPQNPLLPSPPPPSPLDERGSFMEPSTLTQQCVPFPDSPDLLRSFLLVAPHIGFFFHIPRFLDAFKRSMPPTRTSPIPPALVFSVLLLDSVFGDSHDRKFVEPQLLAMALQHLSSDLDPSRILYTLQAEVLISLYLLHQNRRLGASYHVSAAVSIAVACGLHKICSASPFVGPQLAIMLPLAIDAIEEGERIRAFWTVYILDRGWTMCTYASSALLDEDSMLSQIDTPWPMELHEYEKTTMFGVPMGLRTVQRFLAHPILAEEPGQSILSLRVKASILFEKSVRLSISCEHETPASLTDFQELDNRIQHWSLVLPPLALVPVTHYDILRGLLTVKTMCCCATILVHSSRGQGGETPLNDRVAAAALEAAALLREVNLSALQFVDSVVGILWGIVGKTLIACLGALRNGWTSRYDPITLMTSLHEVMAALEFFGKKCPLLHHEWSRLQSKMADACMSGIASSGACGPALAAQE